MFGTLWTGEGSSPRDSTVRRGRAQVEHIAAWSGGRSISFDSGILLLHEAGGDSLTVAQGLVTWRYAARAGHFDFFPAGTYSFAAGVLSVRAMKLAIPLSFQRAVSEVGGWRRDLRPLFDFKDKRLENLLRTIGHADTDPALTDEGVVLLVSTTDRLFEIGNCRRGGDRSFTRTVAALLGDYIDRNLGLSMEVERVASLAGLSQSQFSKMFVRTFGTSFHQFIISRRMEVAAKRLHGNQAITEISYDLGFSSHAHFSASFRAHMGVSPKEYRQSARSAGGDCTLMPGDVQYPPRG